MKRLASILLILVSLMARAQNWLPVGQGFDYSASILYTDTVDNILYAGGNLNHAEGKRVNGVARWDGSSWDSLRGGITDCNSSTLCSYYPQAFFRHNGYLYMAGTFRKVDNKVVTSLARWNGVIWDSVSTGAYRDTAATQTGSTTGFAAYNNKLLVTGSFFNIGGLVNNGLAVWNDTSFSSFPATPLPAVNNSPFTLGSPVYYNGMWYFIGLFYDTAGHWCNVGRWTGAQWEIFGGGLYGGLTTVSKMLVYQNKLYLAGTFTQTDGNPGNAIVSWDGSSWDAVGGGITDSSGYYGQVFDMTIYNNELWVVGNFQMAGNIYAKNIAKWDGSQWCSLGSYFDNAITAVAVYDNDLIISGGFWTIDGDSINRVAKWAGGNYTSACILAGMQENTATCLVQVYPDPASDKLVFSLKCQLDDGEIIITDQVGREIRSEKINGERRIEIPVADLASGMYFYQLNKKGEREASGKVIVQH